MCSKTFLAELLKKKNHVPTTKDQECLICQEKYETKSSGSETAERQIRLPCNAKHTVGSRCIAHWLQDHNTCPICRAELFPAERSRSGNEPLYISLLDDDDEEEEAGDDSDEEFSDEEGKTDLEDENMSSEGEFESEDDEDDEMSD